LAFSALGCALYIGAAMEEGDANAVAVCGRGVAGASALIAIGDDFEDDVTPVTEPTGTDTQYWSSMAGAGENPVLRITPSGDDMVLSWWELWDGFSVQTSPSLAPQAGWVPLDLPPELLDGQFTVTVPASSGVLFRLCKPQ
jgi:hypothetical protein